MNEPKDYIEAGFRSCDPKHGGKDPRYCTHFFQKRVKDVREEGVTTLYFINVFIYDFSGLNGPCHNVSADARLYTEATGGYGIEMQVSPSDLGSAQKVVEFYADAYKRLDCIPDPHN